MCAPNCAMRRGARERPGPPVGSGSAAPAAPGTGFFPVLESRGSLGATTPFQGRPLNRIGGPRAPRDGPPTRFGGIALLLTVLCAALLLSSLPPLSHATPSIADLSSTSSASAGARVTLEAYNSGQVSYLAGIAHLLKAGDTIDLGRSLANNTPDIATLNAWAQQLSPHLPAGVTLTARVESLPNVRIAASSLSPLFGGIMIDYEPSLTFFPSWTWNFTAALAYYASATAICHQYHRLAYAYPSGRALLEGDLQKDHWSYGAIAKVVDFVDIEAQSDASPVKWPAAISKLTAQFAAASVPIDRLTAQISLGSGGNGVSERNAIEDGWFAANSTVGSIYIWWSMTTEPWVVPIVSTLENLTVRGGAVTVESVSFTESGLPAGTAWWVNLTHGPSFESTTTNVSFTEPNGSYAYTVASADIALGPRPASGEFSVAGSAVTVPVTFDGSIFPVTFTESGLVGSLPWSVTVAGQPAVVSSGPTLSLSEPNGTYNFSVGSINLSYSASPASGRFTIDGSGIALGVTFALDLYPIRFVENGLSAGTSFRVTLVGNILASSNGTIEWHEPNGSYLYTVATVPGFSLVSSSTGQVVVVGHSVTVDLTFVAATPGTSPTVGSSAGPTAPVGELLLVTTAIGAAVGIASWRISSRGRRVAPGEPSAPRTDLGRDP